jgi:hypothetical protein
MKSFFFLLFRKKTKNIYPISLALFFVSLFAFYSASFYEGASLDEINRFDRLLLLDNLEKKQPTSNFLHVSIQYPNDLSFDDVLNIQGNSKKTLFRETAQSYCVAGNNNSPKKFDFSESDGSLISSSVNVVTVQTFTDSDVMESIALPLYRNIGLSMSGRWGAEIGTYISSSTADALISSNSSFFTYDDIIDKPFIFQIAESSADGISVFTASINNIYFDSKNSFWDSSAYSTYFQKYLNYYDYFKKGNNQAIIVSSQSIFEKYGISLCVDLSVGFGTARDYIYKVLGTDYFTNGFSLRFYFEKSDASGFQEANGLEKFDNFCISNDFFAGMNFWIFPLIFLFGFLSVYFFVCFFIDFSSKYKHWFLTSILISCGFFIVYQITQYALCYLYPNIYINLAFNPFGNVCVLLLLFVCLFLLIFYFRKTKNGTNIV